VRKTSSCTATLVAVPRVDMDKCPIRLTGKRRIFLEECTRKPEGLLVETEPRGTNGYYKYKIVR
jgi:hypothetical protein